MLDAMVIADVLILPPPITESSQPELASRRDGNHPLYSYCKAGYAHHAF